MINQQYPGTSTSRRYVKFPGAAAVKAGDPLIVGSLSCVALDSAQLKTDGSQGAVCLFGGSFTLTVVGESVVSPQSGAAIKPGDKVHASGGTTDSTTNVTYGFTLTAVSADPVFGYLDPSYVNVASAATDTAAQVLLTNGM